MKEKSKQITYHFAQVFPLNVEDEVKRAWVIVFLYVNSRLLSEGRASCCIADIKAGLYTKEQGIEIATGRAKLAFRKRKSYGRLPEGYYKGAYYGPQTMFDRVRDLAIHAGPPIKGIRPQLKLAVHNYQGGKNQ